MREESIDNDNIESNTHIQSYGRLFGVLVILLFLTAITIFVSRMDFGSANIWVAVIVASIKSSFVLLFFMHLKYESILIKASFLSTVGFLAILIGFMFWDVAFR
ncbi:MAG: cytochrome C oxidase subunit IV family protein [Desulfamplus sp.]|nr:cytochrome C oxidase subunit IV family protein [Desulfamplus sp.]